MEKKTESEFANDEGIIFISKASQKNLGTIKEHNYGNITDKQKFSFARQMVFCIFLIMALSIFASFWQKHDDHFIQFAQQLLPIATLIIGNYFNK